MCHTGTVYTRCLIWGGWQAPIRFIQNYDYSGQRHAQDSCLRLTVSDDSVMASSTILSHLGVSSTLPRPFRELTRIQTESHKAAGD